MENHALLTKLECKREINCEHDQVTQWHAGLSKLAGLSKFAGIGLEKPCAIWSSVLLKRDGQ